MVRPLLMFAFIWNLILFLRFGNFVYLLFFMSSGHLILILKLPLVTGCAETLGFMLSIWVLAGVGHFAHAFVETTLPAHAIVKHISIWVWTSYFRVMGSILICFFLSVFSGITISAQSKTIMCSISMWTRIGKFLHHGSFLGLFWCLWWLFHFLWLLCIPKG